MYISIIHGEEEFHIAFPFLYLIFYISCRFLFLFNFRFSNVVRFWINLENLESCFELAN